MIECRRVRVEPVYSFSCSTALLFVFPLYLPHYNIDITLLWVYAWSLIFMTDLCLTNAEDILTPKTQSITIPHGKCKPGKVSLMIMSICWRLHSIHIRYNQKQSLWFSEQLDKNVICLWKKTTEWHVILRSSYLNYLIFCDSWRVSKNVLQNTFLFAVIYCN